MPVYEYQCDHCGERFTRMLKIDDRKNPESEHCPKCGEKKVHQAIFTVPGIADPVRIGVTHQDNNFKEVLKGIHDRTPGSTINTYL